MQEPIILYVLWQGHAEPFSLKFKSQYVHKTLCQYLGGV